MSYMMLVPISYMIISSSYCTAMMSYLNCFPPPSMLSSLFPVVNTKRLGQDNDFVSLHPIRNDTRSSVPEPIPTNAQRRCLEPSESRDAQPTPATRTTSSVLSTNNPNKSMKPLSYFICVFLHIFLVLLHLVLLALSVSDIEHRLVTSESGVWMTMLSVSAQAFYAVRVNLLCSS